MPLRLVNNGKSTLAATCLAADTTCTIAAGDEALKFSALTSGRWFHAYLVKADRTYEIVKVEPHASADVFNITRAQQGTTALDFDVGDAFECRLTWDDLDQFLQKTGGTMSAPIVLSADPTQAFHATTKQYVDAVGTAWGQCYLSYSSASEIILSPHNGNKIMIDGTWRAIPDAGVTMASSVNVVDTGAAMVDGTAYYVYVKYSGGSLVLEPSSTAPTMGATYPGLKYRGGDTTRTLVGMARLSGGSFRDTSLGSGTYTGTAGGGITVLSWYNRRRKRTVCVGDGATTHTASTFNTHQEVSSQYRIGFLCWADSQVVVGSAIATFIASASYANALVAQFNNIDSIGSYGAQYGLHSIADVNDYKTTRVESSYYMSEGHHVAMLGVIPYNVNPVSISFVPAYTSTYVEVWG